MDDKKKKYVVPEAEITEFVSEDIIALSGGDTLFWGGEVDKESPFGD